MNNQINYIVTEKYLDDLTQWLNSSLESKYGKRFEHWGKEEQVEAIQEFEDQAVSDLLKSGNQYIKDKHLIKGSNPSLKLLPEHFTIEIFNPFTDNYESLILTDSKQ